MVLKLELPGSTGWSALATIRELSDLPIIGLSSLDGEMEKVRGLRCGADDFMTKPVGRQEMLARVESLLQRRSGGERTDAVLADEYVRIDRQGHRVEALGVEVDLTPIETIRGVGYRYRPRDLPSPAAPIPSSHRFRPRSRPTVPMSPA